MNDAPDLEVSQLSQEISSGGRTRTISVEIYKLENETS